MMTLTKMLIACLLLSLIACTQKEDLAEKLENTECNEALLVLDSIHVVNPGYFDKHVYLYYKYSYCLGVKNDYPKAISLMIKYLNYFPNDLNGKMILGHYYFASGQSNNALNQFISVWENNSSYSEVNYNLAIVYLEQSELKTALKHINLEIDNQNNPDFQTQLIKGEILVKMENWNLAVECFNSIPYDEFGYYEMQYYLTALKKTDRFSDAEQFLLNLAVNNPEQYDIYNELASVAIETGGFNRAKAYLNKSQRLESNPNLNQYLYFIFSNYYSSINNLDSCCYFLEHYNIELSEYSGYENLRKRCCN